MTTGPFRTYQAVVYPAQCDAMGHMTVQYYVAAFDQAMWNLVYTLGWRPPVAPTRAGFADVRHITEYKSELVVGAPFVVDSIPLRAGKTSFVSAHRMFNLSTGELAAEMEMTSVHFDLEKRTSIDLPILLQEAVRQSAGWPGAQSGVL